MVAYSFQEQFIDPIELLIKRHTMRNDRKRHARPWEELQLYYAMRNIKCRLIGRAICAAVSPVRLNFKKHTVRIGHQSLIRGRTALDRFAISDGFSSWDQLIVFWQEKHEPTERWEGVLIEWKDFQK